jgi:hypothetical protein
LDVEGLGDPEDELCGRADAYLVQLANIGFRHETLN